MSTENLRENDECWVASGYVARERSGIRYYSAPGVDVSGVLHANVPSVFTSVLLFFRRYLRRAN